MNQSVQIDKEMQNEMSLCCLRIKPPVTKGVMCLPQSVLDRHHPGLPFGMKILV